MDRPIGSIAIYLLAGMKAKIKAPVDYLRGHGWHVKTGIVRLGTQSKSLINGFCVEDNDVGEIEAVSNEAAVIYSHRRAEKNSVWFFALTGEMAVCNIVAVPIHDHSSIVQGGPAYGTYFSDDTEVS